MASGSTYSDLLTTNALPDALRVIFSAELEFTARPMLVFDQPEFIEVWPEFGLKRGQQVTRTVFHQLPRAINQLTQNQDITAGSVQDHQISLTIGEYGNAEGTTEYLDTTSYFGPVSSIVKTLLGPQMSLTLDNLAKHAFWYAPNLPAAKPTYITYANNSARTARSSLTASDNMTVDMIRQVAHRLRIRRVPTVGLREPAFLCLAHPSASYDLRNDTNWTDAQKYAGATRIFNGELGMMYGVRFIQTDQARIANGGALIQQTTLAAGTYAAGTNNVNVTSASGYSVGMEITLHVTGDATNAVPAAGSPAYTTSGGAAVNWVAPNDKDPHEEAKVIASISGNNVVFTTKLDFTHNAGEYMTEALDIYPCTFLGGVAPVAKGVALPPEVRVALPTDILRRMTYVGWYTILGYGVQRDWAYEMLELTASQNVPLVYGI